MAAQWYQTHLGDATKIVLITNDRDNKRKATEEGISAETGITAQNSFFQPMSTSTFNFNGYLQLSVSCSCYWLIVNLLSYMNSVYILYGKRMTS